MKKEDSNSENNAEETNTIPTENDDNLTETASTPARKATRGKARSKGSRKANRNGKTTAVRNGSKRTTRSQSGRK
jgi:hypothetical protein